MNILIVPARSGSKRIKNKNIIEFNDKPLLVNSLIIGNKTRLFDIIHLSTDSEEYAKIARKFGFKTLFLRDKRFAKDQTPVLDAVKSDLLNFKKLGYSFKDVCVLSSTSPFINKYDILNVSKIYKKSDKKSPIISVAKYHTKIERAMKIKNGKLKFINKEHIYKQTQKFSESYYPTGNIFYFDALKLLTSKSYNYKYKPYMIDNLRAIDIDDKEDLNLAKKISKIL